MSPVPEPASAALRRLHEELFTGCLCGLPACKSCVGESIAKHTLRNALLALADLVKAVEQEPCSKCGWTRVPCQETPLCRALAALRERLEAKP